MTDKIILSLLVNTAVFSVLLCAMLPLRKAVGKKASPLLMLVMWAVVLMKLVIPFGFESGFSILPVTEAIENQPYEYTRPAGGIPDAYAETDNAIPADYSVNAPVQPAQNAYAEEDTGGSRPGPSTGIDWKTIALGVWGAGAVIVGAVLCLSAADLRRRIKHARTAAPQYALELADQCKRELGIRRDVSITVQSAFDKPMIMGAVKPVLVLPENRERLDGEALRHVLLHELTHLKGGDLWVIKFMNIMRATYWFNPFVWVCFKLIREDIEIACDQKVIKTLGFKHRLSYIETVLSFAGRKTTVRSAAAIGLFDGRPSMERRIKGMYGKTKTGIKGRITAVLIALLILAISALTACQPAAENAMNAERVESRWEYNKEYGSGRSLDVDAAVYSTDAKSLPALTVVPKPFESGEKIKTITNLFCPNAKFYYQDQADGAYPNNVVTYITQGDVILAISSHPDPLKGVTYQPDTGADGSTQVKLVTEADDITITQVKFFAEADGSTQINLTAKSGDSTSYIDFANWDNKFEKQDSAKGSGFYYESDSFNYENSESYDRLVTPGSLKGDSGFLAAKEKADGYVNGMGIDYMALNSVSRGEGSYSFYYTRTYNGLPETYVQTHTGTTVTGVDGAPTIFLWNAEYLYIEVQNGNVVKARWENPSEIKSVDNEKSKALAWEQIKEIFLEQMDGMMTSSGTNEANSYVFSEGTEVVINRVELGYTKLLTEGTQDDYRLIPTWMFLGYQENEAYHPLHEGANTGAEMCFVTINAIDGTVIDRGQGL